jgi:hypothetical protein
VFSFIFGRTPLASCSLHFVYSLSSGDGFQALVLNVLVVSFDVFRCTRNHAESILKLICLYVCKHETTREPPLRGF